MTVQLDTKVNIYPLVYCTPPAQDFRIIRWLTINSTPPFFPFLPFESSQHQSIIDETIDSNLLCSARTWVGRQTLELSCSPLNTPHYQSIALIDTNHDFPVQPLRASQPTHSLSATYLTTNHSHHQRDTRKPPGQRKPAHPGRDIVVSNQAGRKRARYNTTHLLH